MALNARHKRFADEYVIDLNGARAAIAAGYKEKTARITASKLLTKANIQQYISDLMAKKDKKLIASQDEVLEYLTSVMRREKKEHIVVTVSSTVEKWEPDANGTMRKNKITTEEAQVVEIPAKLSDANRAAELMGRRYSLFTDKVDVGGAIPVIITGEDAIPD